MNDKEFIEELDQRNVSLVDFFHLLDIWDGMKHADKETVVRNLIVEEEKKR